MYDSIYFRVKYIILLHIRDTQNFVGSNKTGNICTLWGYFFFIASTYFLYPIYFFILQETCRNLGSDLRSINRAYCILYDHRRQPPAACRPTSAPAGNSRSLDRQPLLLVLIWNMLLPNTLSHYFYTPCISMYSQHVLSL